MNDKYRKTDRYKKGEVLICLHNVELNGNGGSHNEITHHELVIGERYIAAHDSYFFYNKEYIGIEESDDAYPVDWFESISQIRKEKIKDVLNEI